MKAVRKKSSRVRVTPNPAAKSAVLVLPPRALQAIAIGASAVFLVVLAIGAGSSTEFEWNSRRLVRAFAFIRGLKVYYPLGEGPLISGFNGPTQILAYLPTTLFGSPSSASAFGVLLSVLWFYVPAFFAIRSVARGDRELTLLGFTAFGLLCLGSASLFSSSILVHGDSPSLGLAFLASALLLGKSTEPSRRRLAAIATCAVLAISSKVTVLPIVLVLPFYAWYRYGRAMGAKLLAWEAGLGALLLSVYVAVFGKGLLTVNLITPTRIPWVASLTRPDAGFAETPLAKLRVLGAAAAELSRQSEMLLLIALFAGVLLWQRTGGKAKALRTRAFWLPALMALMLVPPSLLGRVKLGGGMNTLSPALAFATIALIAMLVESAREVGAKQIERVFLAVLVVVLTVNRAPLAVSYASIWKSQTMSLQDEAYRYSLQHPETAYFPEYPLSGLMAEGRVYHSLANLSEFGNDLSRLTPEVFRQGLPRRVEMIALRDAGYVSFVKSYLPEFVTGGPDPELPGWLILRRPSRDIDRESLGRETLGRQSVGRQFLERE